MLNYILIGLLIVSGLFLVVAVLLQNGKSHGLSGAISGGAETFFGKGKGRTLNGILRTITKISAVLFVALSLVLTFVSKF